MDPERVKASLQQIRKVYRRILDDTTQAVVIPGAVASVDTTKREYDYAVRNRTRGFTPEPWGYTITHDQPLRFKPSKPPNGVMMQVDIYCDVRWMDDDTPVKQDIKVRTWSEHDETIFDPDRDAQRVFERLADPTRTHRGRVVSRFHFDKANPDQKLGPEYHLQIGGNPEEYELCWHPKKVNVPRFDYRPMELFLVCQMIAANFFWDEYLEIREKREWREELILYQDLLLERHYEDCLNLIRSHESLLDGLWVT
jgi:hypothetical protein